MLEMKRCNDIGRHITKLRRLKGWSQDLMASKMQLLGNRAYEMTRQVLGNIECGRTNVYHWQIEAIQTVLKCSYDEIFNGPAVNNQDAATLFKKARIRRHRRKPAQN
jgi:transcriptional regulator with XRE-family HTH domain